MFLTKNQPNKYGQKGTDLREARIRCESPRPSGYACDALVQPLQPAALLLMPRASDRR